jgi:hypothetical protein
VAVPGDLCRRLGWDDSQARLRPRERGFDIEILLRAVLIREHTAHRFGTEHVAEDGGIDDGRRHGSTLASGQDQIERHCDANQCQKQSQNDSQVRGTAVSELHAVQFPNDAQMAQGREEIHGHPGHDKRRAGPK